MFHKAVKIEYGKGTALFLTFQTGEVKEYDISVLFQKYPQMTALKNRRLFTSGKLMGGYGIIWNDDLDLETETVYEEGKMVSSDAAINITVANALLAARAKANMSQAELAKATGIDQADISKIECGLANPSIGTLKRLAKGLDAELNISFDLKDAG
ncbi:MAG: helix-turn-helix domain-containing protein [Clostridia bacterium]|nr:helix-turn-helix domain-containing protein [Clostridia bacterium]